MEYYYFLFRNSTKPTEVIIECSKESTGPDYASNIQMISLIKKAIISTLKTLKTKSSGDKILENSINVLKEISYLTDAFGTVLNFKLFAIPSNHLRM